VRKALQKLGQDISVARRKRRIPAALMAERCFIVRNTLKKVEDGNPGVSIGIYATVLFVLGLTERLADLADASNDPIGAALAEERLPKRIRMPKMKAMQHGA
jgi:hypothetical protein